MVKENALTNWFLTFLVTWVCSMREGSYFGWKVGMKIALGKCNKQSVVTGSPLELSCFPTACITGVIFSRFSGEQKQAQGRLGAWDTHDGEGTENHCLSTHYWCLSTLCVSGTPCSLCAVDLRSPKKCEKITPIMKTSFPINNAPQNY